MMDCRELLEMSVSMAKKTLESITEATNTSMRVKPEDFKIYFFINRWNKEKFLKSDFYSGSDSFFAFYCDNPFVNGSDTFHERKSDSERIRISTLAFLIKSVEYFPDIFLSDTDSCIL